MALYTFPVQIGLFTPQWTLAFLHIILHCNVVLNSPRLGSAALTRESLGLLVTAMNPSLLQLITILSSFFLVRYPIVRYNTLFKGFCLLLNYVLTVNKALKHDLVSDSINGIIRKAR